MKKMLLLSAIALTMAGCGFTLASKAEKALRGSDEFKWLKADQKMELDHVRESSKGRFICGTVETIFRPQRFTIEGKTVHLSDLEPKSHTDRLPWYDEACDVPEPESRAAEY
jgi:hypothetical protein